MTKEDEQRAYQVGTAQEIVKTLRDMFLAGEPGSLVKFEVILRSLVELHSKMMEIGG